MDSVRTRAGQVAGGTIGTEQRAAPSSERGRPGRSRRFREKAALNAPRAHDDRLGVLLFGQIDEPLGWEAGGGVTFCRCHRGREEATRTSVADSPLRDAEPEKWGPHPIGVQTANGQAEHRSKSRRTKNADRKAVSLCAVVYGYAQARCRRRPGQVSGCTTSGLELLSVWLRHCQPRAARALSDVRDYIGLGRTVATAIATGRPLEQSEQRRMTARPQNDRARIERPQT
jgi:hypothetical protein